MPVRAAVYCRISKDAAGEGLGVRRQEQDCVDYCARREWLVAETYVDNDLSAYSGRRRAGYEAMLEAVDRGLVDAIVVWHPDRLHRSPAELERFITLVERTGTLVHSVTAGDYDLSTPEGRLTARIVGSVARKESEDKSRRLRRKHVELAELGRVSGGGRRPFGYEADRLTVRPSEAAEIRSAVARVLAGESLRSVAQDWRERGIATVTGAAWSPTTVKRLLMSARISGQREHHGRIVGPAQWPAIIRPDDTVMLRVMLGYAPSSKSAGTPRTYLLSGLMFCGGCGAKMTARPVLRKGHRYRRYVCAVDRGGCGRVGIGAEPTENLVAAAVVEVLSGAALDDAVAERDEDRPRLLLDEVAQLEGRLVQLAEMFAAGSIGSTEWLAARESVDRRLVAAQAALVAQVTEETASVYAGRGEALRAEWDSMAFDRRRAVVAAVVDRVTVAPTTRANNRFDAGRLDVSWRV